MRITAPVTEAHRKSIAKKIAVEQSELAAPERRFDQAIAAGDEKELRKLLSDTWFGVPESISCWSLVGFAECVELLDG